MSLVTRRRFVQGAAAVSVAGLAGIASRVHAAEFTYKFASNLPATHPLNVRMQEAAAKILQESGGKLEIRVFPNNQLGGDTDMLSQLRSGALEMFTLSGNILSTLSKPTSLYGVGYAFADYKHVWEAVDGDMGKHLRGLIEKLGLHALDKMWDNGFRQITSSTHPISTPDDLKGFKIRVPVSPQWTSLFKSLGASPTSINFSEVYSALQTRIVDGQENAIQLIENAKLYEVQKYVSVTNHMWDGFFFLVNARAWAKLPAPLQEIAARNIDAAALKEREDLAGMNKAAEDKLKKAGMVFNSTDPAKFRAVLSAAGYYKEWKATFGPEAWALLEKYSGKLD
ncbi:MAG TPA: TRAP transporter substrate-binding protein [Burkholderiales bacterium]|nr:TRAP transporter substrate-binding protein [Burkholderiales bacterium]